MKKTLSVILTIIIFLFTLTSCNSGTPPKNNDDTLNNTESPTTDTKSPDTTETKSPDTTKTPDTTDTNAETTDKTPEETGEIKITDSGIKYRVNKDGKIVIVKASNISKQTKTTIPGTIEGKEVVEIGVNAFIGDSTTVTIELPNTIKKIGNAAFLHCSALSSIDIPDSVVEIGKGAFADCAMLSSINLSKNLKKIGGCAFENCISLKKITIPKSVTDWGPETFIFSGLESVVIENGITEVPYLTFASCKQLKEIVIPSSVVSINESVFDGCESLEKVLFEGNAPATYSGEGVLRVPGRSMYTIYYHQEATGFTSPEWYGYPTQIW